MATEDMILLTRGEAWDVLRVLERTVDTAERSVERTRRRWPPSGWWRPSCSPTCSANHDRRIVGVMMSDPTDVVPTLEAAEQVGLDVVEVYKMIDDGRLAAEWNGRRIVVRLSDLRAIATTST